MKLTYISPWIFLTLFDKIKQGLGLLIRAKASNSKISGATYEISSISTEGIDTAELIGSVNNYIVKPTFQLSYSKANYYIVTKTWYCKSLKIILGNLSQTEIEFLSSSLANQVDIKLEKISQDAYAIVCDKKVAFGVNFARLDFDRIAGNIEVNIVPHQKHLVPFAESDSIPFKYIDSEGT